MVGVVVLVELVVELVEVLGVVGVVDVLQCNGNVWQCKVQQLTLTSLSSSEL